MPKILVVDDDVFQTRALEGRLQAAGYDVCAVNDAHEAAKVIFGFRPNLAIIDINMPSYTGPEFHECLQQSERGRNIPVVYLSGNDSQTNRQQAKRQRAAAFLTKPYEASVLLDTIRDVLEQQENHRGSCLIGCAAESASSEGDCL